VPLTQLWLLSATNATPRTLKLGIHSLESQPVQYRLQLSAGADVIREWPVLVVAPGATWEESMTLTPEQAKTGAVTATLYRLDAPDQVYRRATWQPGS
jgi:hypothetical protein